jgi:hypothetical protein
MIDQKARALDLLTRSLCGRQITPQRKPRSRIFSEMHNPPLSSLGDIPVNPHSALLCVYFAPGEAQVGRPAWSSKSGSILNDRVITRFGIRFFMISKMVISTKD